MSFTTIENHLNTSKLDQILLLLKQPHESTPQQNASVSYQCMQRLDNSVAVSSIENEILPTSHPQSQDSTETPPVPSWIPIDRLQYEACCKA